MKRIIMYLLLLIVMSFFVSAEDFVFKHNYTELPMNETVSVYLKADYNISVIITYSNFTSGEKYLNFYNNNSTIFDIDINIPQNTTPDNYTSIVHVYSNNSSYRTNITFLFMILDDRPKGTTPYVQTDINEYEYTVCDFSLPLNYTKDIVISSHAGQNIQALYDESWFDIISDFIMPDVGYKTISIKMMLRNITVGTYKKVIKFNVISDDYSNITFKYNIVDCPAPPPSYDKMIKACSIVNKTYEEILECERLKAEYQVQLYEAMLDASEQKVVNNTVVVYQNVTDRVPVLDLDDSDLLNAIKSLPLISKQLLTDNRNKDTKINEKQDEIDRLMQEKENVNADVERRVKMVADLYERDLETTKKKLEEIEDKTISKSAMFFFLFVGFFIIIIGSGVYLYNENIFY